MSLYFIGKTAIIRTIPLFWNSSRLWSRKPDTVPLIRRKTHLTRGPKIFFGSQIPGKSFFIWCPQIFFQGIFLWAPNIFSFGDPLFYLGPCVRRNVFSTFWRDRKFFRDFWGGFLTSFLTF